MSAADAALVLLSILAPESSSVAAAVGKMAAAPFARCEWTDVAVLDEHWGGDKHSTGPRIFRHGGGLPPRFDGLPANCRAVDGVARLLELSVTQGVKIESLAVRSDEHGLTIEFVHGDFLDRAAVITAFVERSGDQSDRMMFALVDSPSPWRFETRFTTYAPQASCVERALKVPGGVVAELAQEVLA